MLIPAIDLKGGRVVQLVQGQKLALATDDLDGWMTRFAPYPRVQVIDLDGALESGENAALVARICQTLPCRVGGGIRTIDRAKAVLGLGAHAVIVSSALFRDGRPDLVFAAALAEAIGPERVIAAIDSKGGKVVIRGWTESTLMDAADAARALEPVLRRVPLHARRYRGPDAGHPDGCRGAGARRDDAAADRGRRHHHAGRD